MVFAIAKKATAVKALKGKAASMAEMMQIFDHAKKVGRVCFRCVCSLVLFQPGRGSGMIMCMIMPRGARLRFAHLHYTCGSNQ